MNTKRTHSHHCLFGYDERKLIGVDCFDTCLEMNRIQCAVFFRFFIVHSFQFLCKIGEKIAALGAA